MLYCSQTRLRQRPRSRILTDEHVVAPPLRGQHAFHEIFIDLNEFGRHTSDARIGVYFIFACMVVAVVHKTRGFLLLRSLGLHPLTLLASDCTRNAAAFTDPQYWDSSSACSNALGH